MRALIVSEPAERREALAGELRRAGCEIAGISDADGVMEATRRAGGGPDVFVVDLGDDPSALRLLIGRARDAAEDPLRPVLVMLPEYSSWLRGALPADLRSVVAVSVTARPAEALSSALAQALGEDRAEAPGPRLSFDEQRHEASGRGGTARLTPSESTILAALIQQGRGGVTHDRLALQLWGSAFADRYGRASIRTHVHTLRRKLASIGLADAVISMPSVGYRLVVDSVLPVTGAGS